MNPWLAQFQNPLFGEISRNVRSWEFNPASLALILATGSLILLSIACSMVYNRRLARKRPPRADFAIREPARIREILTMALEQRSRIELSFEPIDAPHRFAACSLEDFDSRGLTIELPDYLEPRPEWKGRSGYLFFGLETGQDKQTFYTFPTILSSIFRRKSGRLYCTTPFPDLLHMGQKRRHFRFEPPSHLVKKVVAWNAIYSQTGVPEQAVHKWPPPLFQVSDGKGGEVLLVNISACGIRLKVFQPARRKADFDPAKNRALFLFLEIRDPEKGQDMAFWFSGTLRNYYEDYTTRDLEIGLQFIALGEPDPDKAENLSWKKIDCDEGVTELENWIVKRHMELYREKGLT